MTHVHAARPQPGAGVDRAADERAAEGLLDTARADETTRVLVIRGDTAPLADAGSLLLVAPSEVPAGAEWGLLGRTSEGAAVLLAAFAAADADPFAAPGDWGALRVVGGDLGADDASLFVEALSLGRWLLDAPFCPACGSRTETRNAGWSRTCPSCGREHFPRTDPAVIVAVTSADDPDALLLGSNALWPADRFSCFAGFVEAGESLESTVSREVHEESGVRVQDIRYHASQAWPYPRSLMLGFYATAVDDAEAEADGEEIITVRWFTRAEIGAALAGEGDVVLPGTASIAHRLISEWHAATP